MYLNQIIYTNNVSARSNKVFCNYTTFNILILINFVKKILYRQINDTLLGHKSCITFNNIMVSPIISRHQQCIFFLLFRCLETFSNVI